MADIEVYIDIEGVRVRSAWLAVARYAAARPSSPNTHRHGLPIRIASRLSPNTIWTA